MRVMSHNWSATKQSTEYSRDKPPLSFVRGQDLTMCDIVWVSPQGHRSASVSRHFLLQAPQCLCSVRKQFSRDHCCRRRSKPDKKEYHCDKSWPARPLHQPKKITCCVDAEGCQVDICRTGRWVDCRWPCRLNSAACVHMTDNRLTDWRQQPMHIWP